jgi:hypothetical protein
MKTDTLFDPIGIIVRDYVQEKILYKTFLYVVNSWYLVRGVTILLLNSSAHHVLTAYKNVLYIFWCIYSLIMIPVGFETGRVFSFLM